MINNPSNIYTNVEDHSTKDFVQTNRNDRWPALSITETLTTWLSAAFSIVVKAPVLN